MTTKLPDPVCTCGSNCYVTHAQREAIVDGKTQWTTRAERVAHPDWKVPAEQHLLFVPDETWITCAECKKELTKEHVEKVWTDWRAKHPEWQPRPLTVRETTGGAIINSDALARVDFK